MDPCDDLNNEDDQNCVMEKLMYEIINGQNKQIQTMRGVLEALDEPEYADCKVPISHGSSSEDGGSSGAASILSSAKEDHGARCRQEWQQEQRRKLCLYWNLKAIRLGPEILARELQQRVDMDACGSGAPGMRAPGTPGINTPSPPVAQKETLRVIGQRGEA
eukprot:scaffold2550_cov115-Cylindrotheca_fusiformis.AAC.1